MELGFKVRVRETCSHDGPARTLSTGGMAKEKRSTRFVSPFRMESPFCSASGSVVKCRYRKYRRTSRNASLLNTCVQMPGCQQKPTGSSSQRPLSRRMT